MHPLFLQIADSFFFILHLGVIAFNVVGWMLPATRRANLGLLLLTAASWFGLGQIYGIGYCPLTDWHWEFKAMLGETGLPNNFIIYVFDYFTGITLSHEFAGGLSLGVLFMALLASLYVNLFLPKR